jgi:hypothetical protein
MLNNLALAEYLTMFVIMIMVLVVVGYLTQQIMIIASVEILTLLFGVAIGWIDAWVTILISMAVAGLWTFGTMKENLK